MPLETEVECCSGFLVNTNGDLGFTDVVTVVVERATVAGGGGGANWGGGGGVKPSVVGDDGTAAFACC